MVRTSSDKYSYGLSQLLQVQLWSEPAITVTVYGQVQLLQ